MVTLVEANAPGLIVEARRLFREYAAEIAVDLCFQNFAEELAALPGKYAPPDGRLLLAESEAAFCGCVAVRKLEDGICEMKRLYVHPRYRKGGTGKLLAARAISEARRIGYRVMRLDTLASMKAAIALYERLGFRRIKPYCYNPEREAVFMELTLA